MASLRSRRLDIKSIPSRATDDPVRYFARDLDTGETFLITGEQLRQTSQISQIKHLLNTYLGFNNNKEKYAIEFILNSYLVAVGFRPLFLEDMFLHDVNYQETYIQQTMLLFPQLSFDRVDRFVYVHHPLLQLDIAASDRDLGALLNFIDFIDLKNPPADKRSVIFFCQYQNVQDIILTSYMIYESTQLDQINNKVFQLELLLKPLDVHVYAQIRHDK